MKNKTPEREESLDSDAHKELLTYLDERGIGKEVLHERSSIVNR